MSHTFQRQQALRTLLKSCPVVPVITIENEKDAVPLANALLAGGITTIEITLRTEAALAAAKAILKNVPEALVGIGTVLTPNDLAQAQEIGAGFALSPGATPRLLEAAAKSALPFVPGIATPSEIMQAQDHGFDVVKLFPAMAMGGLATLRALAAPFPQMRFCPTGGISETTARDWLNEPSVIALGGSWIAPPALIEKGAWDEITERARKACQLRS